MGLTEKYRRVPSFVRESLIREAVNMIPTDATKKSKIKSAQRLLAVVDAAESRSLHALGEHVQRRTERAALY